MAENFISLDTYADVPYGDTKVVEIRGKVIEGFNDQLSLKGESYSQYIVFEIERYYDGIDLTSPDLEIQIAYQRPSGHGDVCKAVDVSFSDSYIRFAWLVPYDALTEIGLLRVMPFVFGRVDGRRYILKTLFAEYEIHDALQISEVIEQPTDNWYLQFVDQIVKIGEFSDAIDNVISIQNDTLAAVADAESAKDAAIEAQEAAEAAAEDAAESAEAAENFGADLKNRLITNETKIDAQAARIDAFAHLSQGSTTGDAELMDIRTGYDGSTYASAGTAVRNQVTDIHTLLANKIDDAYVEDGYLYLTGDDEILAGPLGPFSGGGGGGGGGGDSGNNAVLSLNNTSGWLSKTIAENASCPISLSWSSLEDGIQTGNGTLTVSVNSVSKVVLDVAQGAVTIDVKDYLAAGSNQIKLNIKDVYGNSRTLTYTVIVAVLTLRSTFDPYSPKQGSFSFPYVATSTLDKTVYFFVDNKQVGTEVVTTSGRQQTYTIPAQTHGSHTLKVYFEVNINNSIVRSNELYYDVVCIVDGNSSPVIVSTYNNSSVDQFSTVSIPYYVYDPLNLSASAVLKVNDVEVSTLTVDRTEHVWNYRADEVGRLKFTITVRNITKTIVVNVAESSITSRLTTQGLVLSLSSAGRSNSEAHPEVWTDGTTSCTLSGFNFTSDGWVNDESGSTVLRVTGDARVTIPYKLFQTDFKATGKTIEIDFATRDVLDYDAVIFSCMNNDRGLEFTANSAVFKSELTTISTAYKENEHVRLSYAIEQMDVNDPTGGNRLIYTYIDGIMSGAIQYKINDDFSQSEFKDITIGSNYCTIDIYAIRIYDHCLTRYQVLDNWIADTQNAEEMIARYEHNNVIDEYDNVAIAKLPSDLPYMVISCRELPQFKGDKKGTTEEDPVSIQYTDPVTPSKSFTATGVQLNVQGTSSAVYPRKNYDLQFKGGFDIGSTHEKNYALRDTVVPFNRFVLKADVASSEGANNVELVRLFVDINPYKFREKIADPRVREGIDGFPIVLFWNDTVNNTTKFMGKYNFNLPKRAPGPYGYSGDDESWEFQNNTSSLMLFHTDFFDESMYTDEETGETKERWRFDYEARFPSDEWTNYAKLQELQSFIYSTYRPNATNRALPAAVVYDGTTYTTDSAAYRLAKFKAEFGNYAEVQSFIFYYLFTELFLMVDSRAKNLFIGFHGSDTDSSLGLTINRKAVAEPYDMDTAIGINNEGTLAFGYSLEDTDHLEGGADIFNGQESALWCNVRDAFPTEIANMYRALRSAGTLSYPNVEGRFEEHQSKWSESIFNEDSYFKYLAPLVDPDPGKKATEAYLSMLQGSKKQQRRWWLYNRFRYMDSKYNAGDALMDVIQLRGYAKADITLTPYADVYATIKYGSYYVQQRAQRNHSYTLACPLDNVNDTEIYIYSASQISSIGDLSGLKVGFADFSNGTKLTSLKIGDASPSYNNANLKALYVGTNGLLQTVDVRNCSILGTDEQTSVDLSGAKNIEYVYFDGTAVKSVSLPNGGILKVLHLPSTITNLTIQNQTMITDLTIPSYANLTTLRLENVSDAVPTRQILAGMPAGSRIRITGFDWTVANASEIETILDFLDTMRGISETGINQDHAYLSVSGIIRVPTLTGEQAASYKARGYKYIKFIANSISCTITYKNHDGSVTLGTEVVNNYGNGTRVNDLQREATAQYTFTPHGWGIDPDGDPVEDAILEVSENRTVYAAYDVVVNTYTVTWRNTDNSILLVSRRVPYGDTPEYTGITPTYDGQKSYGWSPDIVPVTGNATYTALYLPTYTANFYLRDVDGGTLLYTQSKVVQGKTPSYSGSTPVSSRGDSTQFKFDGWVPRLAPMYEDVNYYASFTNISALTIKYLRKEFTEFESNTLSTVAEYGLAHQTNLKTVKISATNIERYAFDYDYALNTIELTNQSATTFNGGQTLYSLRNLIARSSSVLNTSLSDPLSGSLIANKNGAVYVPSGLVSDYKNSTKWGKYLIYSIDNYPMSDLSSITDTWEEIFEHEEDGTYSTRYSIGDTKLLEFGDYRCYMRIAAFDTDTLASGGTAKITWVANDIPMKHAMNSTDTTEGGWKDSEMRSWLRDTIYPLLPVSVRSNIKDVIKPYCISNTGDEMTATDNLWIPSVQELNGTQYIVSYSQSVNGTSMSYRVVMYTPESSGTIYDSLFTTRGYTGYNTPRIRTYNNNRDYYWTRTVCGRSYSYGDVAGYSFVHDDDGGWLGYSSYSTREYGVLLGFCT